MNFAGIPPAFIPSPPTDRGRPDGPPPGRRATAPAGVVDGTLAAMGDDPATDRLLDDERLTTLGLLIETNAGLASVWGPELESFGLTGSTFEVMLRLARSPGRRLRMSELSAQCALTSSGLTRLVDRLETAGAVVREPCATDRRGFYAVLTDAGRDQVLAALPAHLATIERTLTGVLDPDELDALQRALRKVRAVVKPDSDPELATVEPASTA